MILTLPGIIDPLLFGRLLGPPTVLTYDAAFPTVARPFHMKRETLFAVVEGQGAGASGAGAVASAGQAAAGGGGGGGAYGVRVIHHPRSCSYIVGAGATGDSDDGAAGGTSSFVSSSVTALSVAGGSFGQRLTTGTALAYATPAAGGAGSANGGLGVQSLGDFRLGGVPGGIAARLSATIARSGAGGGSRYGGGGAPRVTDGNGNDAVAFGAGGGGALSFDGTTRTGGNGGNGVIVVWEFGG